MGRFYGEIGFATQDETAPGTWQESVQIRRNYYGDILRNVNKMQESSETLNDSFNIDNRISIVADTFAYQNFANMRYIKWMGILWKIRSIEVQRPRLILTIGGVYNEQT